MSERFTSTMLPLLAATFTAGPPVTAQEQGHDDHGATPATAALPAGGMEHGPRINSLVLVDQLEIWDADPGTAMGWKVDAWFGSDINRLWLRSAGERVDDVTEGSELEILYGRSFAAWWDIVAGIKHDFKPGDSRNWAAFGVEGLLPGKFEATVMAYAAEGGHFAASVEVMYDLLITNRLILQPMVELSHFAKSDPARGIASGLQGIGASLRLRYELSRQFAPYLGVVYSHALGNTADQLAADGEDDSDTSFVAGIRAWF